MPKIFYQNFNKNLVNKDGDSILETSLLHNIPHAHACGGNAICSSCRVCIVKGLKHLLERNEKEQRLADKLGFTEDIRLGCQTKLIGGEITIKLPVTDEIDVQIVSNRSNKGNGIQSVGELRELSFMFADIEGFTPFTESHPPYDVVHILNRYYYMVGKQITQYNGFIVDFFGDGFLAVFGVGNAESHGLDAVIAGLSINAQMSKFNQHIKSLLNHEFKLRIGIHSDKAIIGTIGMEGMQKLSVIGDGVNFASRIESANKELGTNFLISQKTYDLLNSKVKVGRSYDITVKGKTGIYTLYEIEDAIYERPDGLDLELEVEKYIDEYLALELIPGFLRMVYHDAGDYDHKTRTGGLNGSILHPEELELDDNKFITESMIEFLNMTKMRFTKISYSDLIAITGAVGIRKLGGPKIKVGIGRVDNISKGGTPELAKKDDSAKELKIKFGKIGMSTKELVVLSGAHTLGKANGKPFTYDPLNFTNTYFKILISKEEPHYHQLLHSDKQLLTDPQMLELVRQYATDEQLFFDDFAKAYKRLTWLGQELNQ